jgi:serine/threonine-protein kinase ATR
MTSKIAIKAEHLQTAYSAILQANQLKADFTFVQSAKLYHANEQLHRALQEIEQGLRLLGVIDANPAQKPSYDPAMMQKLAKVR